VLDLKISPYHILSILCKTLILALYRSDMWLVCHFFLYKRYNYFFGIDRIRLELQNEGNQESKYTCLRFSECYFSQNRDKFMYIDIVSRLF
jgi:hypothetical protein